MISFRLLGQYGRLGNQLFQYAFLRTTALRLKVPFYCPPWIGDEIFELNDGDLRAEQPTGITQTYREPANNSGFDWSGLKIQDGTDIIGYFQTEKYFDPLQVKQWYRFREEKIVSMKRKYSGVNFSKSVGCHLRFGDNKENPKKFRRFYLIPTTYYRQALSKVKYRENILIFSDDMQAAKEQLKPLDGNIIFMEGNQNYEDLYLMSLCHDTICSLSTFSWWGAWFNAYSDKTVVVPKEGLARPAGPVKNDDFWNEKYTKVRALRPILDSYFVIWGLQLLGFFKNRYPAKPLL